MTGASPRSSGASGVSERPSPDRPASLLITGGGGFVGGAFVRLLLAERPAWTLTVFDSLTGGPGARFLAGLEASHPGRLRFVRGRVTDPRDVKSLFTSAAFHAVVHFAARNPSGLEIESPLSFSQVNVLGTAMVLEEARKAWSGSGGTFLHLSSYEVYGEGAAERFTEASPLNPSTPYAASKASADVLTLAYHSTFGIRTLVTRTTNIYGPRQSPDKLIPSVAERVRRGEPIPVYGSGGQSRDWIHVEDHNRGVLAVLEGGRPGAVYHLGARCERTNLEVIRLAARAAAECLGRDPREAEARLDFVEDRSAHDFRRALDPGRAERELGFRPRVAFEEGVRDAVRWQIREGGE
ncbi:MAG: dTDP-glucose 4,6-dehydratase [Acidobacteriota bacterium]